MSSIALRALEQDAPARPARGVERCHTRSAKGSMRGALGEQAATAPSASTLGLAEPAQQRVVVQQQPSTLAGAAVGIGEVAEPDGPAATLSS
jgi:hypothetical protein